MSCHICSRQPGSRLHFNCTTCTRNQLYQLRLDTAKILLEKDALGKKIQAAVDVKDEGPTSGAASSQQEQKHSVRWAVQAANTREAQSAATTKAVLGHVEVLKQEIKKGKEEISKRRAALAQRRSDAESANYQLSDRRTNALTAVQNTSKRTEHLWNVLHNKTAESRIFLCREAANLYGLRQKLRRKEGKVKDSYTIGGVGIIDLREMNSEFTSTSTSYSSNLLVDASPTQITTSLSHISHLLVLVSHYLSLRLPAELILPHRGSPLPTIYPPAASYISRDTQHPVSPPHSSSNSPTSSRSTDQRHLPRPRPLFIDKDKTLPKLAKEEPATYNLFLEGISLLAWDIAWVSRTQGLNTSSDSWEDICNMGRNLWQLLVSPPTQASTLMRVLSTRETTSSSPSPNPKSKDSPKTTLQRTKSFPILGHYSHGTAHSFLGGSEGTEFMRTWKLVSAVKVADKVKATLLGEMASAEWELLREDEWEDEGVGNGNGNGNGGNNNAVSNDDRGGTGQQQPFEDASMIATRVIAPEGGGANGEMRGGDGNAPRGNSGWTKLKNR
ncbi:hypothetical protein FQN54_003180 [Arachnomyces sp. PD_36]|nr:hypothetical protein FQN54_003180 [Arachnomyces sp. PD_36]